MKIKRQINFRDLLKQLQAAGVRPLYSTGTRAGAEIVVTIYLNKPAPAAVVKDLQNHYCNNVITGISPIPFITYI